MVFSEQNQKNKKKMAFSYSQTLPQLGLVEEQLIVDAGISNFAAWESDEMC